MPLPGLKPIWFAPIAGVEWNALVLREQPPAPEDYGLSSQNVRLQLITEFFNPPVPVQKTGSASVANGLTDTTLKFGSTTFGHGKEFVADNQAAQPSKKPAVRVYKRWLQVQGRTFLIEEVPYKKISSDLQTLPPGGTAAVASPDSILNKVSATRLLVPLHLAQTNTNRVLLAKADTNPKPGVVLDYTTLNSDQTGFTFQADTTYYITGTFNISGTTTIEGATVVKFAPNASIYVNDVNCQTACYRPAVFTAKDDDTVGEIISGSSGSPSGLYAYNALCVEPTGNINLSHLRFSYAWAAIQWDWPDDYNITDTAEDIQILNGWIGFRENLTG